METRRDEPLVEKEIIITSTPQETRLALLENKTLSEVYFESYLDKRIQELLELVDMWTRRHYRVVNYSRGMRQRVGVAQALINDPDLLFFDEPTSGLDPRSARQIKNILRQMAERGTAVFLSTHILEIAERMCDRIGIINEGKLIAAGTMDELRMLGKGDTSLEDIFLELTGGTEYAEIAEVLK